MENQFVPKFRKGDVLINVDGEDSFTKDKEYVAEGDSFLKAEEEFVRVRSDHGEIYPRYVRRFVLKHQPVKVEEMKEIKVGAGVICVNRRGLEHLIMPGFFGTVEKLYPDGMLKLFAFPSRLRIDRFELAFPKKEAAPPVEKKIVPSLLEELDVKADGQPGTCTYAILSEKGSKAFHVRDVCHARLHTANVYDGNKVPSNEKVTEVALYLKGHVTNKDKKEAWKMFVDYVINRSPVAKCFITKDVEQAVNLGVMMDVQQNHNDLVTAAVFLRTGSEYAYFYLQPFKQAIDLGFSENVAYLYSQWFVYEDVIRYRHQSGGHHVIHSRMDKSEFIKFFKEGLFKNEGAPYSTNHATRYKIFDSIAKESKDSVGAVFRDLFCKLPEVIQVEKWGEVSYSLTKSVENTARVCNMISRVIS